MPNATSQNTNTRPPFSAPTLHQGYFCTTLQGEPIFLSNFLADYLMEELAKDNKVVIAVNPKDELIRQFKDKSATVMLITDIDDILPF